MNKKSKFTKLGAVLEGAKGPFIVLGSPDNPNAQYRVNVEFRVTDGEGKEVAYGKNKVLTLLDPRNRPSITDDQREKIPSKLLYELFLIDNAE